MAGKPKKSGKTKAKDGTERGARSKYDDSFPEIAEGYARRGLSDADIAKNLGISKDAYYRYQKVYPDFYDALKRGKRPANIIVENALFKRCCGYDIEEPTKETYVDDQGKKHVKTKTVKKHIYPDVSAIRFWLINREPDLWKIVREDVEDGNIDRVKDVLADFIRTL